MNGIPLDINLKHYSSIFHFLGKLEARTSYNLFLIKKCISKYTDTYIVAVIK